MVADVQDTDRAKADWNPGMVLGSDQPAPLKIAERPDGAIAMQNDGDGQDSDTASSKAFPPLVDHLAPSNVRDVPSRFTAAQNDGVEQDTSMNRSLAAPVVEVWNVDHVWPLKVPTVLEPPGVPLAPTVAQKVTVGHETSYVAAGPTPVGADHVRPS
jgi:hypothetical protein